MDQEGDAVKLSLDTLKQAGAFTGAPVKREVTWTQGDEELTAEVFVRPLSYQSAIADITALNKRGDSAAGRIASCIVDEDGESIFTPEDITGEADPDRGPLNASLTMALLSLIGEVSGLGKPRKSEEPKKSGASLSSPESAGEPSMKQKSASPTKSS